MTAATESERKLGPVSTSPPAASSASLRVEGAWKLFGHVTALKDVDLEAYPNQILAIVGDNGAGKSTLVKAITGLYRLDKGRIVVDGVPVDRADPRQMKRLGLSAVFQDLALVESLDVATNMYLGQPLLRAGCLRRKNAMREGAAETLKGLGVRLPSVRVAIGELSGGQRQSVAIARAVLADNQIMLFDEPTAALGVRETAQVGETLEKLKARGKALIVISHDLEFVLRHADRIQVMRLGGVQGVRNTKDTTREELVGLITGLVSPSATKSGRADQ